MGISAGGIELPSVSFKSMQIEPFTISCDASLGGITFGIARDAPDDGSSDWGYKVDMTLGADEIAFSPSVSYEVSEKIDLNANMGLSTKGTISHSLSMGYKLTNAK